jgi:hypothetical protein
MALSNAGLISILATRIDFRVEGRRPLELFFRELGGYSILDNPSTSPESISSILGVGTKRKLAIEPLEQLLKTFVLNDEQKEYLFAREKRVRAWLAYLTFQDATDEDVTRILALNLGSAVATCVFEHRTRLRLKDRPDIVDILELCDFDNRISWLAQSETGEFTEEAARWATPKSHYGCSDREKEILKLLVERRTDLIPSLLGVNHTSVRNALGGSRHLTALDHQLRLSGLHDAPAVFSREEYESWIERYGYSLNSLVWNPVCHREVIETVKSHLEDESGIFRDSRSSSDGEPASGVHSGATRRLRSWGDKHRFAEPYEEVSDPDILDWLFTRCTHPRGSTESQRPYDAVALLKNPHLSESHRRELESNDMGGLWTVEDLRRDVAVLTAADVHTRSLLKCDGACSQNTPGARTHCGLARCSMSNFGDIGPQKVGPLVRRSEQQSGSGWRGGDPVQSSPLDEWIVDRLGNDPEVYRTFIGLSTEWDLSIEELVETAQMLSGAD